MPIESSRLPANLAAFTGRKLLREEIDRIWTIDRREVIENIYYYGEGKLTLRPEHYDMSGWPPGEGEKYSPILADCYNRGGWFYGLWNGDRLCAAAVLENRWIGSPPDMLQLKFLHVSHGLRGIGLGKTLFEYARECARQMGARRLYISATPSENTVNFYLRRGCRLAAQSDPELFELEPEDIHLECPIG